MKCSHCQKVHNYKFECGPIKELKTFCGDDEYQAEIKHKAERKKKRIRN